MLSSCGWLAGDFLLCLMFPLQCCDSVLMCAFFLLFCPLPPPPPPPPLATPLPRCRPCRLVPCNLYQRDQRLKKNNGATTVFTPSVFHYQQALANMQLQQPTFIPTADQWFQSRKARREETKNPNSFLPSAALSPTRSSGLV
ncbi:hypothetical protein lerEdw1_007639 [Lerista edwardsae]|nr:hypothetical protein lerEdw1_007639 [Lerista edwardsae]